MVVLRLGVIYAAAEPDIRTGEWKYRIEGKDLEDRNLALVLCFKTENSAFLITIFAITR